MSGLVTLDIDRLNMRVDLSAGTDADHKINGRIVRYAPRTP